MFNLEDDAPARRLAYLVALLLVFMPVLQVLLQIWPLQLGNIQWRFPAAGVLVGSLQSPFLGLAIIALVARSTESRGISRTVGILSAITSIVLIASLVLFVLDALQLRAIVNSRGMQQFQLTSIRVGLTCLIFTVAFAVLAMVALKQPKGTARTADRTTVRGKDDSVGLLIGQEFAKAE